MALQALHEEVKPLALQVFWPKTKVQVFGGLIQGAKVNPPHSRCKVFTGDPAVTVLLEQGDGVCGV